MDNPPLDEKKVFRGKKSHKKKIRLVHIIFSATAGN